MTSSVVELPFNRHVGLAQGDGASLLKLPAGPQYLNHLGTVHASALLALAEASSGEFLLKHLGLQDGIVPVVRRLEAKFRKPAHGSVTSSVSTPVERLQVLKEELGARGRGLIEIAVDLHDQTGAHVLSATVDWFVARAS